MMHALAGIALPFVLAGACLPWLAARLPAAWVAGNAVAWGALLLAVLGMAGVPAKMAWLPIVLAAGLLAAGALALRKRLPATPVAPPASSGFARWFAWLALAAIAGVVVMFLWANAIHPPILSEAVFGWSAPARGLAPGGSLPLRLSGYYYLFSPSDLGWKFLWAVLSLLSGTAVYGALRMLGARPVRAVAGVALPATAFAVLFWGSTGFPDLFATGVIVIAWGWVLSRHPLRRYAVWPAIAAAAWTGPLWGALAAIPLVVLGIREKDDVLLKRAAWVAAVLLAAYWGYALRPQWDRLLPIATYLGRDAWNTARYGALFYVSALLLLIDVRARTLAAGLMAAMAAGFGVAILDLSARHAEKIEVLLHVEGNRMLTMLGVLTVFLALALRPLTAKP